MWKWLKDWRRRNFPTKQEQYNNGYLFGTEAVVEAAKIENVDDREAEINRLFDLTYGRFDEFDKGMRDAMFFLLYNR